MAVVQGYTFVLSGFTFGNRTFAMEGAVATPNNTSFNLTLFVYHFMFGSNLYGVPACRFFSDGHVFDPWPDLPIGPAGSP